jgi:uncharacterized membrane protein YsdA (DUF1294 family)
MSIITLAFYGLDKAQSRSKGWRVPENVLHVLALAGGFAGGWAGRAIFRHKTRKAIFTLVLTIATLVVVLKVSFILRKNAHTTGNFRNGKSGREIIPVR